MVVKRRSSKKSKRHKIPMKHKSRKVVIHKTKESSKNSNELMLSDLTARFIGSIANKIKKIQQRRNMPEVVNRIWNELESFRPAKNGLKREYNYQLNLYGWLKRSFPSAKIEEQKGSSRPDITIDDIAIEIKGPTTREGLVTIADKINRYSQYYSRVFLVLFDVNVSDKFYNEWQRGIINNYKDKVIIVRK